MFFKYSESAFGNQRATEKTTTAATVLKIHDLI